MIGTLHRVLPRHAPVRAASAKCAMSARSEVTQAAADSKQHATTWASTTSPTWLKLVCRASYTRSSGLPVPHRVEDERVVCDVLRFRTRPTTGVLLTVPIPVDDEIPESRINDVLTAALDSSARAGITGPAVTPYVLEQIEKETDGPSIPANLALARNNADLAARVAVTLASTAV
jgi:pseudouridine-5'-phosphate glycosidase